MEANEKTRLSVKIHGETYHMKATENPERVLEIVNMVDEQMNGIAEKMPTLNYKDVAVLAALNIAEEYFKLRDDYKVLVDLIEEDKH